MYDTWYARSFWVLLPKHAYDHFSVVHVRAYTGTGAVFQGQCCCRVAYVNRTQIIQRSGIHRAYNFCELTDTHYRALGYRYKE